MQHEKIFTIFLAVVLMICSLTFPVSAENTEIFKVDLEAVTTISTISSSPVIYNQGDEITVKIGASQNTGITSLKLHIDYDEALLEVVNGQYTTENLFTDQDTLTAHVTSEGDGYFIFYSDGYPYVSTATGTFAQIKFKVKASCTAETAVTVTLFQNSKGNCSKQTVSGLVAVPFQSESATFAIHNIDISSGVVTEPTCTEEGHTTYVCTDCQESVVGNITASSGHAFTHHEAQEATHTQIGWEAYDACDNCDYTTYVEIPKIPYQIGDVNGDDEVTDADAIYLLYATFNPDKYPLNQNGDYNKDELLTDADAVYLLYAIFNPSKYPLT